MLVSSKAPLYIAQSFHKRVYRARKGPGISLKGEVISLNKDLRMSIARIPEVAMRIHGIGFCNAVESWV
jgi:hypothetical protein